jgi:hypothetical protein
MPFASGGANLTERHNHHYHCSPAAESANEPVQRVEREYSSAAVAVAHWLGRQSTEETTECKDRDGAYRVSRYL